MARMYPPEAGETRPKTRLVMQPLPHGAGLVLSEVFFDPVVETADLLDCLSLASCSLVRYKKGKDADYPEHRLCQPSHQG
jgi:hypothetical protein